MPLAVVMTFLAVPFHVVLVVRFRPVFFSMYYMPGMRLVRIDPEANPVTTVQDVMPRQLPGTLPVIPAAVVVVPG